MSKTEIKKSELKPFVSPKMEIINHFDTMVSDIDIYVEELNNQLTVEGTTKIYIPRYFENSKTEEELCTYGFDKVINDQFSHDYTYERVEVPKEASIEAHINRSRRNAISELYKVRDEILKNFDNKKESVPPDCKNLTRDCSPKIVNN